MLHKVAPWSGGGLARRPSGDSMNRGGSGSLASLHTSMNRGGSGVLTPRSPHSASGGHVSGGSSGNLSFLSEEFGGGKSPAITPTAAAAAAAAASRVVLAKPNFAELQNTPADEVTIKVVPRKDTYAASKLLSDKAAHRISHSVQQSLDNFESDWKVVTHPYKPYKPHRVMEHPETPLQTFNAETEKFAREAAAAAAVSHAISGTASAVATVGSARASMVSSAAAAAMLALAGTASPVSGTSTLSGGPASPEPRLSAIGSGAGMASPSAASTSLVSPMSPSVASSVAEGAAGGAGAPPNSPASPAPPTPRTPADDSAAKEPHTPGPNGSSSGSGTTGSGTSGTPNGSGSGSGDAKAAEAAAAAPATPAMSEEQLADPQGWKKKQLHNAIETGMQPYRLKVLKCYDPTYDWKEGTEVTLCQRRALPAPDSFPACFRMSVTATTLSFAFGNVEPFFCELALYDTETRKKVSESFHFHLNAPHVMDMIKHRLTGADAAAGAGRARGDSGANKPRVSTTTALPAEEPHRERLESSASGPRLDSSESKQAVFQLTQKRKSLYLVLMVYKIFQGDVKAYYEAYAKPKLADKDRAAVMEKIKKACDTNYEFRQLFVWSATPLFDESENFRGDGISFGELYRIPKADEGFNVPNLCDAIETLSNPKKRSNLKAIPGTCIIKARALPDDRTEAIVAVGGRLITPYLRVTDPGVGLAATLQLQDEFKKTLEKYSADNKAADAEKERKRKEMVLKAKEIEAKMRAEARAAYQAEQQKEKEADAGAGARTPRGGMTVDTGAEVSTNAASASTPSSTPRADATVSPRASTPAFDPKVSGTADDAAPKPIGGATEAASDAAAAAAADDKAESGKKPEDAAAGAGANDATRAALSINTDKADRVAAAVTPTPGDGTSSAPPAADGKAPSTTKSASATPAAPADVMSPATPSLHFVTDATSPSVVADAAADGKDKPAAADKAADDAATATGDKPADKPADAKADADKPADAAAAADAKPADAAADASGSAPPPMPALPPGLPALPAAAAVPPELPALPSGPLPDLTNLPPTATLAPPPALLAPPLGMTLLPPPVGALGTPVAAAVDTPASVASSSSATSSVSTDVAATPTANANATASGSAPPKEGDAAAAGAAAPASGSDSPALAGASAPADRSELLKQLQSTSQKKLLEKAALDNKDADKQRKFAGVASRRRPVVATAASGGAAGEAIAAVKSAAAANPVTTEAVREVLEFPRKPLLLPNLSYSNLLYVYPQHVYFGDMRNIAVRMQIRETDSDVQFDSSSATLPAIYHRSDGQSDKFLTAVHSCITYHSYTATFSEEWKIELPTYISSHHHLLFTFYNVTAKEGKALKGEQFKKVIGYAFVPLLQDGRLIDESHHLPVLTNIQPQYLLSKDDWKVRSKAVFTVTTRSVSSLYTNDPYVNKFFTLVQIPLDAQLVLSDDAKKYNKEKNDDRAFSHSISKVLRSGNLSRPGAFNSWKQMWYALSPEQRKIFCYDSSVKDAVVKWCPVTPQTQIRIVDNSDKKDAPQYVFALSNPPDSAKSPVNGEAEITLMCESADHMNSWLKAINHMQISTWSLSQAVTGLRNAEKEVVIRFMPTISRLLLALMCTRDDVKYSENASDVKTAAFESLLTVAAIVGDGDDSGGGERPKLLDMFVYYLFDHHHIAALKDKKVANPPLRTYEALCVLWLSVLRNKKGSDRLARYSWFLFDLIIKSMLLHMEEVKAAADSAAADKAFPSTQLRRTKREFVSKDILKVLTNLVTEMSLEIQRLASKAFGKMLNRNFALFLRDLFYILDRADVFDLISRYLRAAALEKRTEFLENKFQFLQIVCDHEHYVQLNRSMPIGGEARTYLTEKESARLVFARTGASKAAKAAAEAKSDLPQAFARDLLFPLREAAAAAKERKALAADEKAPNMQIEALEDMKEFFVPQSGHFLPLVLIKEITRAFEHAESDIAVAKAAFTLKQIMTKHEFDARYADDGRRAAVSMMYIYLLTVLAQHLRNIQAIVSPTAKNDLLAVMLALLRNIPAEYLLQYLNSHDSRIDRSARASWFDAFTDLLKEAVVCFEFQGGKESRREGRDPGRGILSSSAQAALLADDSGAAAALAAGKSDAAVASPSAAGAGAGASGPSSPVPGTVSSPSDASSGAGAGPSGSVDLGKDGALTDSPGLRRQATDGKGALGALESKYASLLGGDDKNYTPARRGTASEDQKEVGGGLRDKRRLQARALQQRSLKRNALAQVAGQLAVAGAPGASGMMTLRKHSVVMTKDERLQKLERAFAGEVAHTILDFAMQVMIPFVHQTLVANDLVQDKLLRFLYVFMVTNQSDHVLTRLFMFLSQLTTAYSAYIWQHHSRIHDSTRCGKWWYEILRHLTFRDTTARESLEVFTYQLMHTNWEHVGSLSRTRAPLFESFAYVFDRIRTKAVGYSAATDPRNPVSLQEEKVDTTVDHDYDDVIDCLKRSLVSLQRSAEIDPAREQRGVSAATVQMREIFAHFLAIIDASRQIHVEFPADVALESMCDHICVMVDLWSADSPRMAVRYLKALYDCLLNAKHFPEAAAVQARLADVIASQMARSNPHPAPYWTADHFVSCLRAASALYERCEHYELAAAMENRLIAHFQAKADFAAVLESQKRLVTLYTAVANYTAQGDVRAFGTFYRVGFYGAAFGDLHGKEFVYKEPRLTQLGEIHQRLTGFYSQALKTQVGVFKDGNAVDLTKFDALKETKLQITALDIYYGNDTAEESVQRRTHGGRHMNLGYFCFDTPFTLNPNRSHGNAAEQYKRRTVLAVAPTARFPYSLKRSRVVSRSELVLTPIEATIEDINKRLDKLRKEIEPDIGAPALKTLNQVLSGSVNMQVHGGAEEVCQLFLAPEVVGKFELAHVHRLRDALGVFLALCEQGLKVSRSLIDNKPADVQFQEVLENGYKNLLAKVSGMVFGEIISRPPPPPADTAKDTKEKEKEKEKEKDANSTLAAVAAAAAAAATAGTAAATTSSIVPSAPEAPAAPAAPATASDKADATDKPADKAATDKDATPAAASAPAAADAAEPVVAVTVTTPPTPTHTTGSTTTVAGAVPVADAAADASAAPATAAAQPDDVTKA